MKNLELNKHYMTNAQNYGVRIKFLGGPRGFIDKKRSYFGIGTSLIPQIGSIRFLLKCSFD